MYLDRRLRAQVVGKVPQGELEMQSLRTLLNTTPIKYHVRIHRAQVMQQMVSDHSGLGTRALEVTQTFADVLLNTIYCQPWPNRLIDIFILLNLLLLS